MKNAAELPGVRRVAGNVLATWGVQLSGVLFAIFTVPLIIRSFGLEGLGVWLVIQQVTGHLQLFEVGLNTSLGRFLSREIARGDMDSHDTYLSSAFGILSGAALLVVGITIILTLHLPELFNVGAQYVVATQAMLLIAGIATAIMLPLRVGIGLLSSRHRFDVISKWEFAVNLLKAVTVLVVCLGAYANGLIWLTAGIFGSMLVCAFLMLVEGLNARPVSRLRLASVSLLSAKALVSIGASALVITASAVVLRQGTPIFVGAKFGIEAVPLLALPLMIITSLGPFVNVATRLIAPVASQTDATNERQKLFSITSFSSQYALSVAFLVLCLFAAAGKDLITLWLGSKNISSSQIDQIYVNTYIILGSFCLTMPGLLGRGIMAAVGQHWQAALNETVSVMIGLIIGCILVFGFSTPVWGMALGIATTYVVRVFARVVPLLSHYFRVSRGEVYRKMWGEAFIVGSIILILTTFINVFFGDSWMGRLIGGSLCIVLWGSLSLAFVVTPEHRAQLWRLLKGRMRLL